jgi:hypothetical protein
LIINAPRSIREVSALDWVGSQTKNESSVVFIHVTKGDMRSPYAFRLFYLRRCFPSQIDPSDFLEAMAYVNLAYSDPARDHVAR